MGRRSLSDTMTPQQILSHRIRQRKLATFRYEAKLRAKHGNGTGDNMVKFVIEYVVDASLLPTVLQVLNDSGAQMRRVEPLAETRPRPVEHLVAPRINHHKKKKRFAKSGRSGKQVILDALSNLNVCHVSQFQADFRSEGLDAKSVYTRLGELVQDGLIIRTGSSGVYQKCPPQEVS